MHSNEGNKGGFGYDKIHKEQSEKDWLFFFPPAKSGLKASPVQEVEEKKKKKKKKHVSPLSPCCSDDALSAPMWTDADGRGGERHASASPHATTMWLRQPGVSTAGTRVCVCVAEMRVCGEMCAFAWFHSFSHKITTIGVDWDFFLHSTFNCISLVTSSSMSVFPVREIHPFRYPQCYLTCSHELESID